MLDHTLDELLLAHLKTVPALAALHGYTGVNEGDEASKENAGKYSDLRVNSSPGALRAYRESVAARLFLDRAR